MEAAGAIRGALTVHVCVSQSKDLTPTHGVAKLICRPRTISAHLRLSALAFDGKMIYHVVDSLGGCHAPGMKAHIENDAHRPPQQVHQLEEARLISGVKLALTHQLLGVKRPALDHDGGPDVPPHLGGETLSGYELEMVSRVRLVSYHRGYAVAAMAATLLRKNFCR